MVLTYGPNKDNTASIRSLIQQIFYILYLLQQITGLLTASTDHRITDCMINRSMDY